MSDFSHEESAPESRSAAAAGVSAEALGCCSSRERSPHRDVTSLLQRVEMLEHAQQWMRQGIVWLSSSVRSLRGRLHTVAGTASINADRLNRLSSSVGSGLIGGYRCWDAARGVWDCSWHSSHSWR